MEEKELAAYKAGVDSQSVRAAEAQAKIGHLTGELMAYKLTVESLVRRAKPHARAELADLVRTLLLDMPPDAPTTYADGFTRGTTQLLALLAPR